MEQKKKNEPWTEGEYENWGRYMQVKKAKLEEQYQEEAATDFKESSSIFRGIAIFVNGYTNPPTDELRRLMMAHGGIYHHYLRPRTTTHMIASNLPYTKIVMYKKAQNPLPLCKPEWIIDSIKAGKLLDFRKYLLYSQCTKTQPQLANIFRKSETSNSFQNSTEDKINNPPVKETNVSNCTKNSEFLSEFYNNSRLHHISTMGAMFKDYVNNLRNKSDENFAGLERLRMFRRSNEAGPSTKHDSDSEDDMFGVEDVKSKQEKIIMHIDMDCFFVSVGLRNRPELKGFPVAVAHAKGNKTSTNNQNDEEYGSMSEVASCSYEARKCGVKNGMFLGQALKLCPNLKTIRYDFDGYKEVSYALYDIVASYTLDIEAVSCDEMYVDCTKVLAKTRCIPMEFAQVLRKEIKEKTGCPVSTGFGGNKLRARLATRKAKPDGQFYLKSEDIYSYVGTLAVRDLPGVGSVTAYKLKQMNVKTCLDLQSIPISNLQKEFGKKTGELLYNMCRGIDHTKLNLEHVRKSISAEVNYGIRFENNQDATRFFEQLSEEVCSRLKKAEAKGKCITLKLMVRAKEAPKEAAKFMGHGLCDYFTRSKNLISSVDDVSIITKEVLTLWQQLQQPPENVRGIGIQISQLESLKNKNSKNSNLLNFINKAKINTKQSTNLSSIDEKINILPKSAEFSGSNGSEKKQLVLKEVTETNNKIAPKKIQKKQETYFKETKSTTCNKPAKVKMPPMQEIDMSVLVELPEDIRNEILNEYKTMNQERNEEMNIIVSNSEQKSENVKNEINEQNLSFSQVDPDFLAALSEDMRNDVKMYCQMMNKRKDTNKQKVDTVKNGWDMFKRDKKKGTRNSKVKNSIIKNRIEKSVIPKTVTTGNVKNKEQIDNVPDLVVKGNSLDGNVEKVKSNVVEDNQEIMNFDNKRFFIDNEKVEEHRNILTTLVNCLLDLPVNQVKMQIQTWISNSENINEVDFLSLATYLGMLPKQKRIEDLHVLLKTMHRCVTKSESCIWHETYKKIAEHIQHYMQLEYNSDLILPPMGCSRCTR